MLTALEILREKRSAKKKTMEGELIGKLMSNIVDALSMGKTSGSVGFNFKDKEEFNLFIETLQEVVKYNFTIKNIFDKFSGDDEYFEIDVYFDLDKKLELKVSDVG